MEKINIAELLKGCPKGMELDCTLFEVSVKYDGLTDGNYNISIVTEEGEHFYFTNKGYAYDRVYSKCVIFPKGKTTWEGFVPPCKFKDADIIADEHGNIAIYKGTMWYNEKLANFYCGYRKSDNHFFPEPKRAGHFGAIEELHYATEEERARFFQVIKDNGYKWNTKTKTLEKLVKPRFYVGNWVVNKFGDVWHIDSFNGEYYQVSNGNRYCYFLIEEQDKMRLWTIDDAQDGDVLFHSDSASNGIFIFKEILQRGTIQKVICYCDYDSEDGFCLGENHTCCWTDSKILHPATKEQRDLLFQNIKEAGYKWNTETKNLEKLVEPTTHEILSDALATFGAEHQRIMCMEECAELIDALAKYDRGRADAKDVITELADVSIMVEQMAIFFGKEEFETEKERKLKRLQERINEAS